MIYRIWVTDVSESHLMIAATPTRPSQLTRQSLRLVSRSSMQRLKVTKSVTVVIARVTVLLVRYNRLSVIVGASHRVMYTRFHRAMGRAGQLSGATDMNEIHSWSSKLTFVTAQVPAPRGWGHRGHPDAPDLHEGSVQGQLQQEALEPEEPSGGHTIGPGAFHGPSQYVLVLAVGI